VVSPQHYQLTILLSLVAAAGVETLVAVAAQVAIEQVLHRRQELRLQNFLVAVGL